MDRSNKIYDPIEKDSAEVRAERQFNKISSVIKTAINSSGEFKSRMDAAGLRAEDIKSLDSFSKIPVLRKKELISMQQDKGLDWLLTAAPGQLSRIYQSPGPIYDPEGREKDYWGWTEGFYAAGFRAGDLVQMTFSYHLTPAGLMLEEPLREIGCAVIPAGPGNTPVQIQLMTGLPVSGFVGMTSYLKVIAEKAVKEGLDPKKDFKLDVAFVAAERLPESLRNEVEEAFDMKVRQGYGTADLGCIAYECLELGGMHVSSRCYVEICDPETGNPLPPGETGEVVVTPYTLSYPLIRFATGDLSRMVDTPCDCGRTSPKLAGILGRVDDTAKVKGQFIYPAQAAEVVKDFPQIKKFQIVITNESGRDRLTIRLRVKGILDEKAFVPAFQNKIKLRPALEILDTDETLKDDAAPLVDLRTYE
ncbi:phenylacetate--CoA ligase family protein [Maridesulfovibrio hydrothermalis]|uniref:Putative Phenylacetate-coenzyme A ligase n=1 Tax=Maridesulfovibrio hydrothermalis AM13 = DSM 14728 TaxID=1121451 RepID=L0RFU3_9BACT|nr:AMP-binding protein [Maridesulfovibrio hydrothermalis]CCO24406.1 putative Phenylacetate-coenzyme A ligase [Maridesulfovibrio hydrothermalis AM13 = DSM 14728]